METFICTDFKIEEIELKKHKMNTPRVDEIKCRFNKELDCIFDANVFYFNKYRPIFMLSNKELYDLIPKEEINVDMKKGNNKGAYIFIGIIFLIMLLFIVFLPQISKLFGW
jgi:hypothetical protein